MRALLIQLGVCVLVALLLAIGLGLLSWQFGGGGVVRVLRDLSVMVLALFFVITPLVLAVIYFFAAFAIGRFGGKATLGAHWVQEKTLWVEGRVETGLERFAIRPFARATGAVTMGTTFVQDLATRSAARLDLSHETSRWRTRLNRLRGRAILPASAAEPPRRNERDVQPGPGIAA